MIAVEPVDACKHVRDGNEACIGGVVAGRRLLRFIHHVDLVDDADDVLSLVALGVAHHHQQARVAPTDAGFSSSSRSAPSSAVQRCP